MVVLAIKERIDQGAYLSQALDREPRKGDKLVGVREAKVASEPEALITFLRASICRWCASAWKPDLCRTPLTSRRSPPVGRAKQRSILRPEHEQHGLAVQALWRRPVG